MRKRLASATYALALSGIAAPGEARAQGWLKKIEEARQKVIAAQAARDSAAATLKGVRGAAQGGDSTAATAAGGEAAEADGEVVRTSSRRPSSRRPGCKAYNTYQCAASATLGEPLDAAIGGNNPVMFYRFTVDAPGVYRLAVDPMPNRQGMSVNIADGQYHEIGRLWWARGQPGTQLVQIAAPGTYYAQISSEYSGAAAEPFTFTVAPNKAARSTPSPAPAPDAEDAGDTAACSLNNTFQCAEDAAVGQRVTGAIGGNARRLYYRVEVKQPGTMEFVLNPMPNRGGVRLTLTDDEYQRLGRMSYPAGQPKGQLLRVTAPGTYFVYLEGGGPGAERFALTVRQQP